jgi:hypothetical protein
MSQAAPAQGREVGAMMSRPGRAYDRVQLSKVRPTVAALAEAERIIARSEATGRPTCDHPPYRIPSPFAKGIPWRKVRSWSPKVDVAWEASVALAEAIEAALPEMERLAGEAHE